MESSSAVNVPHPDDTEEEEGFFDPEEALAEDEAKVTEPTPEPEPEPEAVPEPEPVIEPTPEPKAKTTAKEKEDEKTKERGSVEREYIVFQRVPLSARALKHLLNEIEQGTAAEPRVAYMELHRPVSRNDKTAIAEAYKANKESLGEKCELAAVSARSFRERTVKPRPRKVEEALEIS